MTVLNARSILICIAITANALCAGGVYSFPLISPVLVNHLKFTQPQITTIALAGMVGQYPFAPLVGKVLDAHGPRTCSLLAAVMFFVGFSLFSNELSSEPEYATSAVFHRLVLYFAMIGLGTVFSYFSILFSATHSFPHYNGVATGTSMALFGSSPLFLSALASRWFSSSPDGVNVTKFLSFLSFLTGITHLVGAFVLPGPVDKPTVPMDPVEEPIIIVTDEENNVSAAEEDVAVDESSPLLAHSKTNAVQVAVVPVPEPQHGSTTDLLQDWYFWTMVVVLMVVVGTCEMVIANLASIFLSFPQTHDPIITTTSTITTHIQLMSIANTSSRLIVGPLADILSPVAAYVLSHTASASTPTYVYAFPRRHRLSRVAFVAGSIVLLITALTYQEAMVRSTDRLWVLSIGVGIAYGTTFTVLPGILSSIWGAPNLGRNFGLISYAPFLGTSLFSYLYAYVAEMHNTAPPGETCRGPACWQTTFAVALGALVVCLGASGMLWHRWRGRV